MSGDTHTPSSIWPLVASRSPCPSPPALASSPVIEYSPFWLVPLFCPGSFAPRAVTATPICGFGRKFNICAKCRTVRYCSQECQRAHWGEHRVLCTALAGSFGPLRGNTVQTIHFDHAFGGAFSLVQYEDFKRHGRAVLFCELTCKVDEFCAPKDVNRPVDQWIRSTYFPEWSLADLATLWENDDSQPPPLDKLLATVDHLDTGYPRQFFVMILACPFDHPMRALIPVAKAVEWDWEWTPDSDESIIGPNFYRDCMAKTLARSKQGGRESPVREEPGEGIDGGEGEGEENGWKQEGPKKLWQPFPKMLQI
ncbi:hypothetical protein BDK51DRAFT_46878 [Blyttiomyces helicus]|uniref:MYND-type domain-containing protein n=1 Tax=Blyttiomyces helicus TaxID=388810 RepID=A0A4P9WC74_9FUNG|nr:hypothetical protein BDK51DRAFT_46878 [Blyttiomyces helicus]|eukprot:RKO89912.1 hypothetical protein BDK51DRAFT_46878 [Blyttiomyces helicus]